MRVRPIHAIFVVAFFIGAVLIAQKVFEHRLRGADSERVGPDRNGIVRVDLTGLGPSQVRFYHFLNAGNQEVRFLVGRDRGGELLVAFDAAENDYKRKLGFRQDGDWLVNNKCETAVRLEEVNAGASGCRPVPLQHRVEGQTLVLAEGDVLRGWRYFN